MQIALSTTEALEELELLLILGKTPPFDFPAFIFETDFIDFFALILERMPETSNVVPLMDQFIAKNYKRSVAEIRGILNQNKADGAAIVKLISNKQLILTSVRKAYNKKVGKLRNGLGAGPWRAYNNWLLAGLLWKAFVQSHDPAYKVTITEYEDTGLPMETFDDPNLRALWAMKQTFAQVGRPTHGNANGDVFIHPLAEWYLFLKNQGMGSFNAFSAQNA
jgi:hypothetical protein